MKKRVSTKIAALIIVAVITMVNTIPAFAMFGPLNNAAGELSSYYGQFDITDGVTAHPDNKLVVTLPDADVSEGDGGSIVKIPNPVDATVTYDDTAKTVTFAFAEGITSGGCIDVTMDGIASPVGEHPYTVELYSGETTTSVALEVGTYVVADNGLTVNLNVSQFFSFGLTTDSLDIDIGFIEPKSRTERAIDWQVSTNASSYVVSCSLKTPFTNGSDVFPAGKSGYTEYFEHQSRGVYIGTWGSVWSIVPELRDYYTGIPESSTVIATGEATNLDQDRINLVVFSDATVKPGTYTGVIEFTGTPTF